MDWTVRPIVAGKQKNDSWTEGGVDPRRRALPAFSRFSRQSQPARPPWGRARRPGLRPRPPSALPAGGRPAAPGCGRHPPGGAIEALGSAASRSAEPGAVPVGRSPAPPGAAQGRGGTRPRRPAWAPPTCGSAWDEQTQPWQHSRHEAGPCCRPRLASTRSHGHRAAVVFYDATHRDTPPLKNTSQVWLSACTVIPLDVFTFSLTMLHAVLTHCSAIFFFLIFKHATKKNNSSVSLKTSKLPLGGGTRAPSSVTRKNRWINSGSNYHFDPVQDIASFRNVFMFKYICIL